jgi:hypothetical protein
MDFEEKHQVPEEWQETSDDESQQVVCEEPQETPFEDSEDESEDIEQD